MANVTSNLKSKLNKLRRLNNDLEDDTNSIRRINGSIDDLIDEFFSTIYYSGVDKVASKMEFWKEPYESEDAQLKAAREYIDREIQALEREIQRLEKVGG